jgi:hypothetical protein
LQGLDQIISVSQDCIHAVLTGTTSTAVSNARKTDVLRQFKHAIVDYDEIFVVFDVFRLRMMGA